MGGSRRAAEREAGAAVVDGDEAHAGHGGECDQIWPSSEASSKAISSPVRLNAA